MAYTQNTLQNPDSGDYEWADGWVRYYTNFDTDGTENGEGCVIMKSNAKWNDTQCGLTYPSVCKTTEGRCETDQFPLILFVIEQFVFACVC